MLPNSTENHPGTFAEPCSASHYRIAIFLFSFCATDDAISLTKRGYLNRAELTTVLVTVTAARLRERPQQTENQTFFHVNSAVDICERKRIWLIEIKCLTDFGVLKVSIPQK